MKPYYQDKSCTIYCGDCREILPQLNKVDLVLTDPPYNVNLNYKTYQDNKSDNEYQQFINDLFKLIIRKSYKICVTPGKLNQWLWPIPKWVLCWYCPNGMTRTPLQTNQSCFCVWEPVLWYGEKPTNPPPHDLIKQSITAQRQTGDHPCPKPLKLFSKLIQIGTNKDVLDPFMGSGTTLRAAKDLGRRAIGIEIEEKYCEIAAKRLDQESLFSV